MKKFWKIFFRILKTVIFGPLSIIGAVCLIPFAALGLIICLPIEVICDIWTDRFWEKDRLW